jgi:hypothetical protein
VILPRRGTDLKGAVCASAIGTGEGMTIVRG